MTKGRPADPTRARRGTGNRPAQGTPKIVKASPVVSTDLVPVEAYPPPENLPEIVRPVWRSIVDDLGGANHMRDSYVPAITAYCEAVYIHAEASANIHEFGILVRGQSGTPVANPLIRVQKDAAATMLRYAETLGLTPAGRIRLGLMEITGMSLLGSLQDSLDRKN